MSKSKSESTFYNAVVLITGAASGIGRQLCLQAAQGGAFVIGADIDEQGLAETQNLAQKMISAIESKFQIRLEIEPVLW